MVYVISTLLGFNFYVILPKLWGFAFSVPIVNNNIGQ